VEARHDAIGNVGVQNAAARALVETISRHSVTESSPGVYSEGVWTPIEKLRLTARLRGDYYDFDVHRQLEGADVGARSDDAVSPKAGIAYAFNDRMEVYGN
jgi:outer membrane receptor protein involved in Fe transport